MRPQPYRRRPQARPGSGAPGEGNSICRGNFAWPSSTLRLRRSSVKLLTVFGCQLEQCFVRVDDLFTVKCSKQAADGKGAAKSKFRRGASLAPRQQNDCINTRDQHTKKQRKCSRPEAEKSRQQADQLHIA